MTIVVAFSPASLGLEMSGPRARGQRAVLGLGDQRHNVGASRARAALHKQSEKLDPKCPKTSEFNHHATRTRISLKINGLLAQGD